MLPRVRCLALMLCLLAARAWGANPVGQVTSVKGTVTVHGVPCHILSPVFVGDKIDVARGGQLTLMVFTDNHRETIEGPQTFVVAANGAPTAHKVVTQFPSGLQVTAHSLDNLNHDQYGIMSNRGQKDIVVLALGTRSLTATPTLHWAPVDGATQYMVTIKKGPGEDPFVNETVTDTSFTVQSPLERGHGYLIRVEAMRDDAEVAEGQTSLPILSAQEAARYQKLQQAFEQCHKQNASDTSPYLVLAAEYLKGGLQWEVVSVLEQLAQVAPDSAYPHQRLSQLYKQLGLDAEAAREAATAEGLK